MNLFKQRTLKNWQSMEFILINLFTNILQMCRIFGEKCIGLEFMLHFTTAPRGYQLFIGEEKGCLVSIDS